MKPDLICPDCAVLLDGEECASCKKVYPSIGGVYDFLGGYSPKVQSNVLAEMNSKLDENTFSKLLIQMVREQFKGFGGSVIDAGCGTGYYSSRVFSEMKDVCVTGVDINSCFDTALTSPNYRFVRADIFKAPFKEGSFDAAVSFDVIEHIDDDAGFVSRVLHYIKPGGLFVIGTPNLERVSNIIYSAVKGKKKFPFDYGNDSVLGETIHVREYSLKDVKNLMDKCPQAGDYKVIPVLFGVRFKKGMAGINRPALGGLGRYAHYWLIAGRKKQQADK